MSRCISADALPGRRTSILPVMPRALGRVGRVGEIVARCCEHADAAANQEENAKLLCDQVAREAACVLYDHRADTVALDPIKERGETRSALDGIGTANSCIVVFGCQEVPCGPRETLDSLALALVAVLIAANVR
jgi:hypothetical protein